MNELEQKIFDILIEDPFFKGTSCKLYLIRTSSKGDKTYVGYELYVGDISQGWENDADRYFFNRVLEMGDRL